MQVRALLDKLDMAETYYASGKMFRTDHAAVGSAEFNARVKCLCMWYVRGDPSGLIQPPVNLDLTVPAAVGPLL